MFRRGLGFFVRPQCQVDAPDDPRVSAGHAGKWPRLDREHLFCRRRVQGRAQPLRLRRHQGCGCGVDPRGCSGFHHQGHPLQLHLPRHDRDAFDAPARRCRGSRGPRDVREPAADGKARHRRGNRLARSLPRQRRERVHDGRRAYHRWRMDALNLNLAINSNAIPGRVEDTNLRCAIAHRGISRFRVWCFEPSRNDRQRRGNVPMNKIDLNGRCAVVTGGAQGFGRAITERFVASGAKVAIWDHDQPLADKTAKEIGSAVTAFKVDVSDLAAVEKTRDATLKTFGKIDILVNNAGIAGVNRTVWGTELDEWRKVLRINLDGPFICCKAIVPEMIRQNYGRIVNIASIAGKEGNANAAHYSASQAGLIALTKSLGKELAGYEIAVNAVTPAAAKTAIFDQLTQQHIDFMLSKIPTGRFVLVEELAAMVAWLASA